MEQLTLTPSGRRHRPRYSTQPFENGPVLYFQPRAIHPRKASAKILEPYFKLHSSSEDETRYEEDVVPAVRQGIENFETELGISAAVLQEVCCVTIYAGTTLAL